MKLFSAKFLQNCNGGRRFSLSQINVNVCTQIGIRKPTDIYIRIPILISSFTIHKNNLNAVKEEKDSILKHLKQK